MASHDVGKLALEAMRQRTRRWRSRKEKEPALRNLRVGSAVELVTNERVEGSWSSLSLPLSLSSLFLVLMVFNAQPN